MKRLATVALCGFIFSIPWENGFVVAGFTVSHLVGPVAFVLGVVSMLGGRATRRVTSSHIILAAFAATEVLSVLWSIDFESTASRALMYCELFGMIWLVWQLIRTEKEVYDAAFAFVCGNLVVAVGILANFSLGRGTLADADRYSAFGANPNEAAMSLAMAIPLAWVLREQPRSALFRWGLLMFVPTAIVAVLLTASRGGVIAAAVSLCALPLTSLRLTVGRKCLVIVLIVVTVWASGMLVPSVSWERVLTTGNEFKQRDLSGRWEIWKFGLDHFWSHPLLGIGSGTYETAMGRELGQGLVAHNTYISVLVELGIMGFSILLLICGNTAMLIKRMQGDAKRMWLVTMCAIAAACSSGSLEYRKAVWLLLALLIAHRKSVIGERTLTRPLAGGRAGSLTRGPSLAHCDRWPAYAVARCVKRDSD